MPKNNENGHAIPVDSVVAQQPDVPKKIAASEDTPATTQSIKASQSQYCNYIDYNTNISEYTGEKEAADYFETEIKLFTSTVADFLYSLARNIESKYSYEQVCFAVNELKIKNRFDSLTIPGMGENEKITLDLLVYDNTPDPIEQVTIRRDIQQAYKLSDTAFDRVYRAYSQRVGSSKQKLKLELKALNAETDPINRIQKLTEICSHYRLTKKEVKEAALALDAETRKNQVKALDLDEFLSQGLDAIEWLIPGIIPKRETVLLAAMPKVGKTLLAVDLAFCLATGESSFLGESVKPAKVLIVSVDESPRSTRAKMLKRGFRTGDPNIKVITNWDISQMSELESVLEEFRPDLTIIDSLKRITVGKEVSENSAEFGDMIYQIKETLERYNSGGLLIHHSNKDKEQTGVGCVRGSTSITGAVWGVLQLGFVGTLYDPTDSERTLTISARDVQGQILNLELDPENNSFKRLESQKDREQKNHSDQVLEVLSQHPYGLNGQAIATLTGIRINSIYTVLSRMSDRRLINSFPAPDDHRRMVYKIDSDTPPPSDCTSFSGQIAETQSQQESQIPDKIPDTIPDNNSEIFETQSQQESQIPDRIPDTIPDINSEIDRKHPVSQLVKTAQSKSRKTIQPKKPARRKFYDKNSDGDERSILLNQVNCQIEILLTKHGDEIKNRIQTEINKRYGYDHPEKLGQFALDDMTDWLQRWMSQGIPDS